MSTSASEPTPDPTPSRRAFLAGAVAAAVAPVLAPAALQAQGRRRVAQGRQSSHPDARFAGNVALSEIAAPAEWSSAINRLVRRATLGLKASDLNAARAQGYQNWLQSQLDYQRIDNSTVDTAVNTLWPSLAQTGDTLFSLNQGQVQTDLQSACVYRAALSSRQLYERMVEFWSDHLNIEVGKVGYLKIIDERDVVRKHALGKFGDLIKASAKSPAMLAYLDNTVSRVGAPNQNYARELLELHTLGVDNGYSQDDVSELSRVLTGWTIQGRGNFTFNPTLHDWGAKVVMGVTIPAGSPSLGAAGIQEGEQIIDMLVRHPNTARYISTKLLKWLLTPEPTPEQISAISSVFRVTNGDIKLVVRAILNSGFVAAAPRKFKRPFHYLVSALRGLNANIITTTAMNSQMTALGQPLYFWETPDGYPDLFEYWSGNLMPRWQFASTVTGFRTGNITVDHMPYLAGTSDAAVDLINTNLFGGEMDVATRTGLLNYLRAGTFNETRIRETLSIAIASESFQWY